MNKIAVPKPRKIAFKALGGRSRATAWHFGVLKGLLERGFKVQSGPAASAPKADPSDTITTFIGSSAGAFFATLVACGYDGLDMLRAIDPRSPKEILRLPRLTLKTILKKKRQSLKTLWRRFENDVKFRIGISRFSPPQSGLWNRLKTLSLLFSHMEAPDLAVIRRHTTEGLEDFLNQGVTDAIQDKFENLAPELYILATNQDQPSTTVFGTKQTEYSQNYHYIKGIPVSKACVASMAMPGLFTPVLWDGTYYSDGDLRGPFFTHVAEDAGADLIFVSSVYQPHRVIQSSDNPYDRVRIADLGYKPLVNQVILQAMHAVRVAAQYERSHRMEAFHIVEEKLKEIRTALEEAGLSSTEIESLNLDGTLERLQWGLRTDPKSHVIYVELPETEQNLFFSDPFDLSPDIMGEIFVKGYRQCHRVLNGYEFT